MAAIFSTMPSNQATRADAIGGRFDPWLLAAITALASLGLVMVASSSLAVAESRGLAPFHYFYRHLVYLMGGLGLMWWLSRQELRKLEAINHLLPPLCVLLLLLVLVPGIGHTVKGARRWINFGFIGFQPAEAAKLMLVVWLASYLKRYADEVRADLKGMLKPFAVAGVFSVLLLFIHKDFGTTALILSITAGMLVLGGVHLPRMAVPALVALPVLAVMIVLEPYRMQRLVSYRNPWADPFGSGYQLSNALMAVGRGEFWGVGLGGSVQKLSYLPESYTDFIMAVIGEELGFVGVCAVIGLYALLVGRAFWLGIQCVDMRRHFAGYLAFGIGLWMALQSFVSIGVNLGLLPTKGLTLPLISSGGSSILMTMAAMGILLRVSYELDRAQRQVAVRRGTASLDGVPPPAADGRADGDDALPVVGDIVGKVNGLLDGLRNRRGNPATRARVEPVLSREATHGD